MGYPPAVTTREFEIVLWGATGFTGRLVADYLATAPTAEGLRWAIAGRSESKLEAIKRELGLESLGLIVANAYDPPSLKAMTARATVVCTTVGPYLEYGADLVAACVENGTHYCDLTGEPPFIRNMIDAHHEAARDSNARIVHCCGFDSIPSDLGVLMMHEAMKERGLELRKVDAFFGESKGGFSGGTVASLLGILDLAKEDRSILKVMGDPYGLDPRPRRGGPDGSDAKGIAYERRLRRWTAPFLMAPINTRIVRRSNAVLEYPYGERFRYTERMSVGGGAKGMATAAAIAGGIGGFLVASQVPAVRGWLEKKLPKAGEGPSASAREAGFFVVRLIAEAVTGETLMGRVSDDRDPGYGSTKVMLGESALCLARDELSSAGGVLTPASAMGMSLLGRLREAGMTWTVTDNPESGR